MRILQVVQKPQRRGPEIATCQLSQALRQQGHPVKIVYLYPYRGDEPLAIEADDILLNGIESHRLEKVPGFHPGLLRRFMATIRAFEPDIIQVNGSRSIKYGAFARLFESGQWRLVYRNIDNPYYWVKDEVRRLFYRHIVMPRLDGVIGVSPQMLRNVQQMYKLEQTPAVYIPHVVDPEALRPFIPQAEARQRLNVPPNSRVLLFMGNLSRQKRPDRFVRVVAHLHQEVPHLQAWLMGDGLLRQEVEQQVAHLGLQEIIRFLGYQAEIGPYLTAADLLLVTSDSDGIPAVILAAGYLGRPTVSTRVGGVPECLVDGETGLMVDPQDEAGLAQATLTLLQNREKLAKLGAKAQSWVQENFTLNKVAGQYLDFYRQLQSGLEK